jgi:hypothetical protein
MKSPVTRDKTDRSTSLSLVGQSAMGSKDIPWTVKNEESQFIQGFESKLARVLKSRDSSVRIQLKWGAGASTPLTHGSDEFLDDAPIQPILVSTSPRGQATTLLQA